VFRFCFKSIFIVRASLVLALFLLFTNPLLAAEPGLNLINQPGTQFYVPSQDSFSWLLYTPGSPDELKAWTPTANNIVIRIHSEWTPIGQLMLGMPSQQQQAANNWCSALNQFQDKNIYVQPFNELEHDYARQTPTGGIGLDTAIIRAKVFTDYLQACLAPGITITSPALEPQSVNFPTTAAAFVPYYSVISCMPYRLDTIDSCIQAANGKPLIFTEIGVDRNGPQYDDCIFIESFCDEGFINKIQSIPNLLAYFLFTFAPGNYSGFWQLKLPDVVRALKNQCTSNLSCKSNPNQTIQDIVNRVKNSPEPGIVAPLPARGVNAGPNYYSKSQNIIVKFITWLNGLLSKEGGQLYPFNFKNEQYVEDPYPQSGQMAEFMTKIIQPTTEIYDKLATISQGSTSKSFAINHANKIESYTSSEYKKSIAKFGPGFMLSTDSKHYDTYEENSKDEYFRDYYDLQSGISPRTVSYQEVNDTAVDKILCQLAASSDPSNPAFVKNPSKRLYDEVLGYASPNKESDYVDLLPIGGGKQTIALPDRTHTKFGDDPVPIKISTIFCINQNMPSFQDKCASFGYGFIGSQVCASTPDWLINAAVTQGLEGAIFRTFYPRLCYHSTILEENASSKAFIERCQEQPPEECDNTKHPQITITSSDFDGLSESLRTKIIDLNNGNFFKSKASMCYACKVDMFFLTNLTKANQAATFISNKTTSYKYQQSYQPSSRVINYSSDDINKSGVSTTDKSTPLGIDNKEQRYDYQSGGFFEGIRSFFTRIINYAICQITYKTDDEGNYIPNNACEAEKKSALTTIIYIPSKAFDFVNSTQNHNNSIIPYASQKTIKETIKSATQNQSDNFITKLKIGYETGNQHSKLESVLEMFLNKRDTSAIESFDQQTEKVGFAPNTEVESTISSLYLMPYSWQKQVNSQSSASSLYESNRPIEGDLPNTSTTPNTDWCQFVTQSITSSTNSLITPSLVAAIISVESGGNPNARSSQGAIGLMQVMPSDPVDRDGNPLYFDCDGHSCFINRPTSAQLLDPAFNINYGIQLLSGMINYWGRDKNTPQEQIREGLKHYGPMNYEYKYADLVLAVQANNPTACQ